MILPTSNSIFLIAYLPLLYVHMQLRQTQSPRTKFPSHTIAGMPQPSTCFRTSEYVASPRPLNLLAGNDSFNNIGASVPVITDINLSPLASMPPEQGAGTDNLVCSSTCALVLILLNAISCYLMFYFVFFTSS